MKVLYGVQGTGNGHISRARAMSKQLRECGIEVDYLFSGREREKFFDMTEFGDWQCYKGLTFIHQAGDLKIWRTMQEASITQLYRDIRDLDLEPYDLVITDFEPISAWAAKLKNKPCIGVGHQYAFEHNVPRRGADFVSRKIMDLFAPVKLGLGLHWHHFDQPILPPIVDLDHEDVEQDENKILVYLGFEESEEVIQLLEGFDDYTFTYYGPFAQYESRGHIQLKPLSRDGFKYDLATCSGVICNAGFELASEAIQLGKKILVKPLKGQMEQLSNARALEELQLGMTMPKLDKAITRRWLDDFTGKRINYPNVAQAISQWILEERWQQPNGREELVARLWSGVDAAAVVKGTHVTNHEAREGQWPAAGYAAK